ncbi:activating transcription factor 7-interacting protein 1 [Anopheles ziemanni]|uniref:activating transcription factor 7-interacting protein 1 n=1 Tax=Anopheles coustani TaxID=139045 RepID=UPI002657ECFD|nr:activating transcription factor 7-interacting protein 1 [Anopheles coustani]XP_058178185.1 activating transcription factor 7-interacting protein 1 [Anopheles ziemanni]
MEVDKPVVSNVDNEKMPVATTDNVLPESPDKSPEMENDELPALVISDSEGDEPSANPTEKITLSTSDRENEVNISGITPLDASVMDGVTKDSSSPEIESVEKPSFVSKNESKQSENMVVDVKQQPSCIYENIDLTGASSADDSGVSDEGTEKMVKRTEECVEKVVKDSASLTAQELLQSLLGDREDDYRLKGFGDETADPKGECSDMIKLNDESLEQNSDQNTAVEPTLDQEKQVSCSSENDPAEPIQDKITTINEKSEENSDPILNPKEDNTLEGPVLVENEAKQQSSEEITSVNEEASGHPDVDKTVACDTQVSRSAKETNNEDDDDDVICLLEEMAEEDQHDSNSLSNEDSASLPTDGAVVASKQSDGTTTSDATVEGRETEEDSIDEPPPKRPRSSESHDQDNVAAMKRLACENNATSDPVTIQTHSSENCDNGNDKPDAAESSKTDDNSETMMDQEESQNLNRSRPSSSMGEPAKCPIDVNTTETIFLTSHFETTATLVGAETGDTVGGRSTVVPSLSSEVLVIDDDDDDDDVGNVGATKIINSTKDSILASPDIEVGEKRPREDLESESTKKPKMANESTDTLDNLVKEDDVAQKPPDVKPLAMEFMKMFGKPLPKMSRDDLEEFVMLKVCEAVVYKSQLGEERKRLDKLETVMLKYRQRLKDMHKQYCDLLVVHERAVQDLQKRANRFVVPVKITRAVGLQVGASQFPLLGKPTAMDQTCEDVKTKNCIAELSVIPAKGNTTSPESSTKDTTGGAPWNGAQLTSIGQRMSTSTAGGIHPTPNVIRPSVPMNVTYMHNATASEVTIKPPDPSKPALGSIVNGLPGSSYPSGTSVSSSGSSTGSVSPGSMTARKKTLHKITPKRPPLSAVQQEEQEKMARQQAEQMLQDIHSQQARIAKIAAGSKVSGGNSATGIRPTAPDVRTTVVSRTNVTLFRPAMLSSLMPAAQPMAGMHNVRASSSKTLTFTNSVAPTAPQSQPGSPSAVTNSLIDLTDEEEPRGPIGTSVPLSNAIEKKHSNQNGMLEKQQGSAEMIATNQMVKLAQAAQTKGKLPYRLLNGNGTIQPIATGSTHTQGMLLPNNVGFRAHLGKKPNGLRMPLGISPTTHGQIRHSGPFPDNSLMMKPRPPLRVPVHPAPLPKPGPQSCHPSWKQLPPQPVIRINNVSTGIVISWTMPDLSEMHAEIDIYQIYAYQESTAIPSSSAWRHVGDVKALPLPMAVTLTHFSEGQRYHFAVRAIDEHKRIGFFSDPRTWNDVNVSQ